MTSGCIFEQKTFESETFVHCDRIYVFKCTKSLTHTQKHTHVCTNAQKQFLKDGHKTPIVVTFWDTQIGVAKSRRGSKRLAFSASEFLVKYANILLK